MSSLYGRKIRVYYGYYSTGVKSTDAEIFDVYIHQLAQELLDKMDGWTYVESIGVRDGVSFSGEELFVDDVVKVWSNDFGAKEPKFEGHGIVTLYEARYEVYPFGWIKADNDLYFERVGNINECPGLKELIDEH